MIRTLLNMKRDYGEKMHNINIFEVMNKNSTWLVFMLIPFMIGVVLHFIIPIQFILVSSPKIQKTYNLFKTEVQQDTIRVISVENARVFQNSIQLYENLRSDYVRLFANEKKYQIIETQEISFNSAWDLANMNQSTFNKQKLDRSMWYAPGVQSLNGMDDIQDQIYQEMAQIQPFLLAVLGEHSEIYNGFLSLKTTFNYQNHTLYFEYPSTKNTNFESLNFQLLTEKYNKTLFNNEKNHIQETIFADGEYIEGCEPLIFRESIVGISCLEISLEKFMGFLKHNLHIPEFQLSKNQYYLLRPNYEEIDTQQNPQIIMNFSDSSPSNINFPANSYFEPPEDFGVTFSELKSFQLYVYRNRQYTFYVLPISITNYLNTETIDLYMLIKNQFQDTDLDFDGRSSHALTVILIPSLILLIISLIATLMVLRWLFRALGLVIRILNEHCSLILRGDLDINIPDYKEAEDLIGLFDQFQILNQLHKYSDIQFFDVPKPQRIIKYIKCYKLFEKLGYDLGNLCQNIADCYAEMAEFKNSVKYMQISVDSSLKLLEEKEGSLDDFFQRKISRKKISSGSKKLQKILRRRLNKLVHFTYYTYIYGDKSRENFERIQQNVDMLKKVTYPKIINMEYLACMMIQLRLMYQGGDASQMGENLDRLGNLLSAYEEEYERNIDDPEEKKPPPDVLRGYWWFIMAGMLLTENKVLQAFWNYVQSLETCLYHPHLHVVSQKDLKKLLNSYNIDGGQLDNMYYNRNYKKREDREYIFLIDVCHPDVDEERLRTWKKKSKDLSQYIYSSFVKDDDRMSIIEFCSNLKINVSLISKKNQSKLLKQELIASIRTRKDKSLSDPMYCLKKAAQRVAHLYQEKYFIVFLKPDIDIDGNCMLKILNETPNSQFIFVMENPEYIFERDEGYFVLDFVHGQEDAKRILQQKEHKPADTSVYVF